MRNLRPIVHGAMIAVLALMMTMPYMVQSYESTRTPLYPYFGEGYRKSTQVLYPHRRRFEILRARG